MTQTQMSYTSIKAYHEEIQPTLGKRQAQILEVLKIFKSVTNTELSKAIQWPINTVTPRIKELRDKGLVELASVRNCAITGRTAKAWRLK